MIKKAFVTFVILSSLAAPITAQPVPFMMQGKKPQYIFVNNRILSKVNGKSISVIDVMKKMDMLFYRKYPKYASSVEARHQFYQMAWKTTLQEMVEKELILSDAVNSKIEVSHGDVRQEIESVFGPNIMVNLDRAGLTHEEAWEMVKQDLVIKKTIGMRVNSKAYRAITPKVVRGAYEDFVADNKKEDQWLYQVISIRSKDNNKAANVAGKTYNLLAKQELSLSDLKPKLEQLALIDDQTTVNITEEQTHTSREASEAYREVLSTLQAGTFSQPIAQQSRNNNGTVYRIFYLNDIINEGVPPFIQVEGRLRDGMIAKSIEKESSEYLEKLRRLHDVQTLSSLDVPENFQPYILQ